MILFINLKHSIIVKLDSLSKLQLKYITSIYKSYVATKTVVFECMSLTCSKRIGRILVKETCTRRLEKQNSSRLVIRI